MKVYQNSSIILFPYDFIPTDSSPVIFTDQISLKDRTILSFDCHYYFSDDHRFSLLGQRFQEWLKGNNHLYVIMIDQN